MISRTLSKITPGIITGVNLTLSTAMAWGTCAKFDLGLQWSLLLVPIYYALWQLLYAGCNRISERIVNAFDKAHSDLITRKQQEAVEEALKNVEPTVIVKDSDYEGAIKFHDHYVAESSIVREQLVREDAEKLDKILSYTKEIFMRLNFSQTEVTQILDCVRYFVSHKDVLNVNAMKISKKPEVTQASLKNFAWNIAFQYTIDGDTTASFVKTTFAEWFANTELPSIKKTLRNTRGAHAVEIDEKILKD